MFFIFLNKNETRSPRDFIIRVTPVIIALVTILFVNPVSRHRVNEAFTQQYEFEVSERILKRIR